jgi:hypothetical protein
MALSLLPFLSIPSVSRRTNMQKNFKLSVIKEYFTFDILGAYNKNCDVYEYALRNWHRNIRQLISRKIKI